MSLRRKAIKKYFNDIIEYEIATNKNFWNHIKSFLTIKDHVNHQDIMIFDGKKIIKNETDLVEVLKNRLVKNQNISHVTTIRRTKGLLYK